MSQNPIPIQVSPLTIKVSYDGTNDAAIQARADRMLQGDFPPLQDTSIQPAPQPQQSGLGSRLSALGGVLANALVAFTNNYANANSSPSYSENYLSSNHPVDLTYQPTTTNLSLGQSNPVVYHQITVNPVQSIDTQLSTSMAQQRAQANQLAIQQAHHQAINVLNQLALSQGLPTYPDFHAQNGVAYQAPPDPGVLGVMQTLPSNNDRSWVPENQPQIQSNLQAAQTSQRLQALQTRILENQRQAMLAVPAWQAAHIASPHQQAAELIQPDSPTQSDQRQGLSQHAPIQAQIKKTNQNVLLEQAFQDPRNPEKNILEQAQDNEVLPASKLGQVELNLDRMAANQQITTLQAQRALRTAQMVTANNWLKQDGKKNKNGTTTYRGMTVKTRLGPLLAYTDAQHYVSTGTRLSARGNWQADMLNTGQSFLEGIAKGFTAGGVSKNKHDLAYIAGDIIGTVGTNVTLAVSSATVSGGWATPAALAVYWSAREANREADAGKPINTAAVIGSGILGALPGSISVNSTLGTTGRVATGTALGYGQDIGTRAIQQLGDTGKVDLNKLDYTPGLGTVTGGLLAHPKIATAFTQYLLGRKEQIRSGEKVPVSYEDFVQQLKNQHGWTDENIAYLENKPGGTPPHNYPFNRPLWSPGPINNPLLNAYGHAIDHPETFNLPPGDPRYVQKVHDLVDNLPVGTELMETKAGMKRYFLPNVGPDRQNIFIVEEATRAPRTLYIPRGNSQEQYHYFRTRGGKYKGTIK